MNEKIKCDFCGRFISIKDLDEGKAYIKMVTPDSHFTKEEYEICCKNCKVSMGRNNVCRKCDHKLRRADIFDFLETVKNEYSNLE